MQIDGIDGDAFENRSQKLDVLPIRWYRVLELEFSLGKEITFTFGGVFLYTT